MSTLPPPESVVSDAGQRRPAVGLSEILKRIDGGEPLRESQAETLLVLKEPAAIQAVHHAAAARLAVSTTPVTPRVQLPLLLSNRCELLSPFSGMVDRIDSPLYKALTIDDVDAGLEWLLSQDMGAAFENSTLENQAPENKPVIWLGGGLDSEWVMPGLEAPTLLPGLKKLLAYLQDKTSGRLQLEGFSLDYWEFLSVVTNKSPAYLLALLQDYGLVSLSGWGSDCLVERVRGQLSKKKLDRQTWKTLTETALSQGVTLVPSLTMGLGQTPGEVMHHLALMKQALEASPTLKGNRQSGETCAAVAPLEIYSIPWDRAMTLPAWGPETLTQRLLLLTAVSAVYWQNAPFNQGVSCATLSLPKWASEDQARFGQECIQVGANHMTLASQVATQALAHGQVLTPWWPKEALCDWVTTAGRKTV